MKDEDKQKCRKANEASGLGQIIKVCRRRREEESSAR